MLERQKQLQEKKVVDKPTKTKEELAQIRKEMVK